MREQIEQENRWEKENRRGERGERNQMGERQTDIQGGELPLLERRVCDPGDRGTNPCHGYNI